MIKKKIEIFSIAAIIIIATTGMPLSFHFCEMTGIKSLEGCNVCSEEMVNLNKADCCNTNNTDDGTAKFVSDQSCCQTEFVLNKVYDEFLLNKTDVDYNQFSLVLHPLFVEAFKTQQIIYQSKFYYDTSPPFLIDPELHITNSVLLI